MSVVDDLILFAKRHVFMIEWPNGDPPTEACMDALRQAVASEHCVIGDNEVRNLDAMFEADRRGLLSRGSGFDCMWSLTVKGRRVLETYGATNHNAETTSAAR